MLCSPPPATTLASSCAGSEGFCAPCYRRSSQRSRIQNRPKTGRTLLLHERLVGTAALSLPMVLAPLASRLRRRSTAPPTRSGPTSRQAVWNFSIPLRKLRTDRCSTTIPTSEIRLFRKCDGGTDLLAGRIPDDGLGQPRPAARGA